MGITSRERVEMALQHEETDRIPIDLGSPDLQESMRTPTKS